MNNQRTKQIMRASTVGIIVNAFLALFKIAVGLITSAISITMDGVNNLSDAGSSLITMVGAALAAKPADRKHPFGYGRMEYLSSLVIAGIILYAGITAVVESIKTIINPVQPEYSALTLTIIIVAVAVKLGLALYTLAVGKKTDSDALTASGKDAMSDVIVSTSTIIAAIIYVFSGLSLEAYLGVVISLVIVKAGLEVMSETVSKILGEQADAGLVIAVKKTINSFEQVRGAYDLVLNNYGPGDYMASVHVEVDEKLNAAELDGLSRRIMEKVQKEHKVYLSAVGFYSANDTDPQIVKMRKEVAEIVTAMEYVIAMHGFYVDFEEKHLRFDIVISLDTKERRKIYDNVCKAVSEHFPEYDLVVGFDIDFNEVERK